MNLYYWYINNIGDPVVTRKPPVCPYQEIKAKNLHDAMHHVKELLFCRRLAKEI